MQNTLGFAHAFLWGAYVGIFSSIGIPFLSSHWSNLQTNEFLDSSRHGVGIAYIQAEWNATQFFPGLFLTSEKSSSVSQMIIANCQLERLYNVLGYDTLDISVKVDLTKSIIMGRTS